MQPDTIYHLVPRDELDVRRGQGHYVPAAFDADGFIHCSAGLNTVVAVANDYYTHLHSPLLVLEISVPKLSAPVRFEAPAPAAGAGTTHLDRQQLFPHIYGPLDLEAITGAAVMPRAPGGKYGTPAAFVPLPQALTASEG